MSERVFRLSGGAVAVVLALVGALHVVWMFGTWPLATREDFARSVVGVSVSELPAPWMTAGVVVLVLAAAYLVAAGIGVLPRVGPRWVLVTGLHVVAAVLLLRGAGGLVADAVGDAPAEFVRLDRMVYSPLCLFLGAGSAWVARRVVGSAA